MKIPILRPNSVALALAALAFGCQADGGGDGGESERPGAPVALERLQIGSVYGVGSHFGSDGLEFSVVGFGETSGNAEVARVPSAAPPDKSGDEEPAKSILLSHVLLRCTGGRATQLEFDFVDHGGSVALEFAGDCRTVPDFIALDGLEIGSVRLSVRESSTAGVRQGRVTASGEIDGFAIGGAALEVAGVRLVRD